MHILRKQILILTLTLSCASVCIAQERVDAKHQNEWGVPLKPFNCETNDLYLAKVRDLVKTQANKNGVLILVARLGSGEKRRVMNKRRLFNVMLKLNTDFDIPPKKIILAEGEETIGFGRVEIYIGGELVGTLLIEKNSDICVSCCPPSERYYPYKDRKQ